MVDHDITDNDKNEASIGAVVMWHDAENGHVSHYFAGDAAFKLETAMASWIGEQIPSLKLKSVFALLCSHIRNADRS